MMKSMRKQITQDAVSDPTMLTSALNDILNDIYWKLQAIAPRKLFSFDFQTKVTVAEAFPIVWNNPGFNVVGFSVVKVLNYTDPTALLSGGCTVQWEKTTDGNGVIRYISGLDINTHYQVQMEAIGNATQG